MRVVYYLNQFYAQIGGEEMANVPLRVLDAPTGPAAAFAAAAKDSGIEVVATLVCGDNYFAEHNEEVSGQITDLLKQYRPDLVVAGPAFNAGRYGLACLRLLDEGWYLAVDPIAGYRVRPCPVHTILMTKDPRFTYDTSEKGYLWAVGALTQQMEKYLHEQEDYRAHARDEKKLGGHSAVDCSIACRSLESIGFRLNLE